MFVWKEGGRQEWMKLSQKRLMRINVHSPPPPLHYCNRCGNNVDCCNYFLAHYPSTSSLLHSFQPLWNVKMPSFLTSVNVDLPISPYMGMWCPKETTLKSFKVHSSRGALQGRKRQTWKHFDQESPLQIVVSIFSPRFSLRKQSLMLWANLLAVSVSKKLARRGVFFSKEFASWWGRSRWGKSWWERSRWGKDWGGKAATPMFQRDPLQTLLLLDFSLATKRKVGLKDAPACFDTSPHNRQDVGEKKRRGAQRTT